MNTNEDSSGENVNHELDIEDLNDSLSANEDGINVQDIDEMLQRLLMRVVLSICVIISFIPEIRRKISLKM